MWSAADASSSRLFADDPRAAPRLGTDHAWRNHHGPRRVITDLPLDWEAARIGDLGTEVRGQVSPEPGTIYDLYSVPAYATGEPEQVDGESIRSGKRPVEEHDVLLCKINPRINRVWTVGASHGQPQIASTEYLVLRLHEPRMAAYVRYYLSSPGFRDWIKLAVEGATGSHTRAKSGPILEQLVPVPPPLEQQQMVATIEEHFSRLDAVEAAVANTHWRLDALRSITMDRAFYGAEAERTIEIGDFAQVSGGIQKQPKRRPRENRYPFLRVANVGRGQLDLTEVHEIELFEGEIDRLRLKQGDLLVVEGNGSVNQIGRAALWNGEIDDCVHQNHLIRVRPGNELLPEYLAMCWNAPRTSQQVRAVASSTSGLYTLSTSKVKSVCIPIVPLPEQRRIVEQLDLQLKGIELAGMAASNVQTRVRALRRAVLAQAFTGQLVPQSPNDDPASAMLERIEAGAR